MTPDDVAQVDQVLAAEVPPAIDEVRSWSRGQRAAAAEAAADIIAGSADALVAPAATGSVATGDDARAALVRGLAILALRADGVTFGGLTWTASGTQSGAWSIPLATLSRKARGAWFTPRELVETITAGALAPLTRGASAFQITQLNVVDIACGSGAFLVAATRHLVQALVDAWGHDEDARDEELLACDTDGVHLAACDTVLNACIYGVDLDPLSAELARVAIQLLVPERRPPAAVDRIKVGDALVGETYSGWHTDARYPPDVPRFDWPVEFPYVITPDRPLTSGFDAVVGNPPYLGGQRLTAALGTPYRKYLVNALAGGTRGSADLAAYFTIRAAELCRDFGVIGLITTNTLLQGATYRVLRAGLGALDWQLHRCEPLRWPGTTASVHCVMVWLHRMRFIPDDLRGPLDMLRGR